MFGKSLLRGFSTGKKTMELGYWNIKGIIEPSRWIYLYFKLDVKEWTPSSDADLKKKLKQLGPFPTLPYLIDGDVIITETSKIPKDISYYLAEKAGHPEFLGKDAAERAQVRMIESVLSDIRIECFKIMEIPANGDHKAAVKQLFDRSGPAYNNICEVANILGEKEYLLGHLTFADFMLQFTARFSSAICYTLLGYSPFADFPNIVKHLIRVSNLPGIKERLDYAQIVPYLAPEMVPFRLMTFREMIDAGLNPI